MLQIRTWPAKVIVFYVKWFCNFPNGIVTTKQVYMLTKQPFLDYSINMSPILLRISYELEPIPLHMLCVGTSVRLMVEYPFSPRIF